MDKVRDCLQPVRARLTRPQDWISQQKVSLGCMPMRDSILTRRSESADAVLDEEPGWNADSVLDAFRAPDASVSEPAPTTAVGPTVTKILS